MSSTNSLRPLPCRTGLFIGVRESIAYLRDPDGFIAERHQQFGPVFGTTLFFRPTAVVGGPDAVEQFIDLRAASVKAHYQPPLPPYTQLMVL